MNKENSSSNEFLVLFPNVHMVMRADKLCQEQGISCQAIPVPEYISSECGMCLLIKSADMAFCEVLFGKSEIVYSIEKEIRK